MTHYGSTSRRPAAVPIWHSHFPHLGTCSRHLLNLGTSEPFHLVDPIQTHLSLVQAPPACDAACVTAAAASSSLQAEKSKSLRQSLAHHSIHRRVDGHKSNALYASYALYDVLDLLLSEVWRSARWRGQIARVYTEKETAIYR
jgi:hypothetical protein